jgi:hypothetical protein
MPAVQFISPLQQLRFRRLHETQSFYMRAVEEIAKPLALASQNAHREMDMALAEIGVPVDGRDVRMSIESQEIFFEDVDWLWSEKEAKAVPRPDEMKAAWLAKFQRGVKPAEAPKPAETPTPFEADTMNHEDAPSPPPPKLEIPPRSKRKKTGADA